MTRTRLLALVAIACAIVVSIWLVARFGVQDSRDASATVSEDLAAFANEITPQIASTDVDLATLKRMAKESCECRMSGSSNAACEQELDAEIERIRTLIRGDQDGVENAPRGAFSCLPISVESVCLDFSDGRECVAIGYNVVGARSRDGKQPVVCSAADAQAIEQAYQDAWLVDGVRVSSDDQEAWHAANERANDAVERVLERILRGEASDFDPESTGCV